MKWLNFFERVRALIAGWQDVEIISSHEASDGGSLHIKVGKKKYHVLIQEED